MSFDTTLKIIKNDFKRYNLHKISLKDILIKPVLTVILCFRLKPYFEKEFKFPIIKQVVIKFINLIFIFAKILAGIELQWSTILGEGVYIPHSYGIVINSGAAIGRNCTIMQNVTIGKAGREDHIGVPVIGDNVFIGAGAVVIGEVKIGNNAAIGANAVVTKDVPDNAVVAGVPAKIINYNGAAELSGKS